MDDIKGLIPGIVGVVIFVAILTVIASSLDWVIRNPLALFSAIILIGGFVYLDEFQNFTTLMLANMMSELRKYGVGLTLAHQHLHQLEPDIRHAVLGNAGTLISFRVGPEDAGILAREFQPKFEVEDLINLPNRDIYLKR